MPPDIVWRPEVGKKVEKFFNDPGYKEYIENAVAFNRKLNEERKMRLPYIDGQTGIAQRHYNNVRLKRERMPPTSHGKVLQYPQKLWHKKRYQYLKYFNHPKQVGPYNSEAEVHTISQVENPMSVPVGLPMGVPPGSNNGNIPPGLGMNEDSNHSGKDLPGAGSNVELAFSSVGGSSGANSREGFRDSGGGWNAYDNNMYAQAGGYEDEESWDQDSGSDYDDFGDETYGSKSRGKGDVLGKSKNRNSRPKGRNSGGGRSSGGGQMGGSNASKRRTHADNIPDSEKPFSCDLCGAHYKTRPGLKYHIGHSHRDKDGNPVAFKDAARISNESQGTFGSPKSFTGFGGANEGPNFGPGRNFSQHHCLLWILCCIIIYIKIDMLYDLIRISLVGGYFIVQ